MKTLPLTVLAHEGPQVRAYLAMMRRAGLKPDRILLMVQTHHRASKRPVGQWLPGKLRTWYAERVQEYAENYWPRRIKASYPYLVEAMARELTRICEDPASLLAEMRGRFRYERYADRVERVLVRGLRDRALVDVLSGTAARAILYTGGGIVPPWLLDIPGIRFLHVHPGYLPHVRGADGLLWSVLVRSRPAASCFCMDRGIDTGDIVAAADYPALQFDISPNPRPDDVTLYRAIFSFYDPILRAVLLVDKVLGNGSNLSDLPAVSQDAARGVTYHFIHPALRRKVLERIFISAAN